MNKEHFSLQKITYLLISLVLAGYLLIIGKSILVPLAFAAVLSFLLKPINKRLEYFFSYRPAAIILSLVVVLLPIAGISFFFSIYFMDIFQDLSGIERQLRNGFESLFKMVNQKLSFTNVTADELLSDNPQLLDKPLGYLGSTISVSSAFILNFFLTFIYTFLLLLYRDAIKQFYLIQFKDEEKTEATQVLGKVQNVIQNYLYGLITVVGILGVLNSLGLGLIGVDYPMFWGFLAAFLAIIPYVGTIVGGLLPFLYTLSATGDFLQAFLILLWFGFVQALEGNIITPKVIGSSVKVNPLAAILAIILGASLWGVAGMILALPFIAILRIVFNQYDYLKPLSHLLSDEVDDKKEFFEEKYDKNRFRILNVFKKNEK